MFSLSFHLANNNKLRSCSNRLPTGINGNCIKSITQPLKIGKLLGDIISEAKARNPSKILDILIV